MERESKQVLEIKKTQRNLQTHLNRIYNILSALYQETQDVKHFVNYKHDDSLGDVESSKTQLNNAQNQPKEHFSLQNSMNILNNVEGYIDNVPKNIKLKVLDN